MKYDKYMNKEVSFRNSANNLFTKPFLPSVQGHHATLSC